jgi:hypothetical protein
MAKVKHPLQPIIFDKRGVARFKKNAIVDQLLDFASMHGFDLNRIAMLPFDKNDRWQFNQLIGYSVSGIGDLDCCDKKELEIADQIVEKMAAEQDAKKAARKAARKSKAK